MSPPPNQPPLNSVIPPLLLGTATFNHQYNADPHNLPTTTIVSQALSSDNIRGFDTSPYYGPAESILGSALTNPTISTPYPRASYFLTTKVGRIAADEFDYSPDWVRRSVRRSLDRLGTEWIDLVLCHDVEFVEPKEVVEAVRALRELRDSGKVRYIGISGYPVGVLCDLAELVLKETGEPLDAVMSYAHYTLQNTRLWSEAVPRLRDNARVGVVLNASPLGMGLLREGGVPEGSMGDWHPAEPGLRKACAEAARWCREQNTGDGPERKVEDIALRWALEHWREVAGSVGTERVEALRDGEKGKMVGVSVIGVSYVQELEATLRIWESVLGAEKGVEEDMKRKKRVEVLAEGVRRVLGEWVDRSWESPGKGYVRNACSKEDV